MRCHALARNLHWKAPMKTPTNWQPTALGTDAIGTAIGLGAYNIAVLLGCDLHHDIGMGTDEPVDSAEQPFGGKLGRRRDRELAFDLRFADLCRNIGNDAEGVMQRRDQRFASFGQLDAPPLACEQLDAEQRLQDANLVTDRAVGDVELRRRPAEMTLPGGRLEGPERIEWGIRRISMPKRAQAG